MFSRKSCLAHCRPNGRSCEAGRACEGAWLAKTAPKFTSPVGTRMGILEDVFAYPDLGHRPRSGRPGVMTHLAKTAPTRAAYYQQPASPPGLPWCRWPWLIPAQSVVGWLPTQHQGPAPCIHRQLSRCAQPRVGAPTVRATEKTRRENTGRGGGPASAP